MPNIRIDMIEGRTVEQKSQLAKRITKAFTDVLKVAPERVQIYFYDAPKYNFAQAGVLRSDQEKTSHSIS